MLQSNAISLRKLQGRDKTLEYLQNNVDFQNELDAAVREILFPQKEKSEDVKVE